jgi:hypothetical protein
VTAATLTQVEPDPRRSTARPVPHGADNVGRVTAASMVSLLILAPPALSVLGDGWIKNVYLIAGVLAGVLVCIGVVIERLPLRLPRTSWVLLTLISLSAIFSQRGLGGLEGVRPYVAMAIVCGCYAAYCQWRSGLPRVTATLVLWCSVGLALLAIQQRIAGNWGVFDSYAVRDDLTSIAYQGRAAAIFGSPVVYGCFSGAMVVLAASLRPRGWMIFAAANVIGVMTSGARGAVLALAACFLATLPDLVRRLGDHRITAGRFMVAWAVFVSCVCAIVLTPAGEALINLAASRSDAVGTSVSVVARQNRVSLSTGEIFASPQSAVIGHGPSSAAFLFGSITLSDAGAATFDDSYATAAYEYGIPILLALAVPALQLVRKRPPVATPLVIFLVIDLLTFDFGQWPVTVGLCALACGFAVSAPSAMRAGRTRFSIRPHAGSTAPLTVSRKASRPPLSQPIKSHISTLDDRLG